MELTALDRLDIVELQSLYAWAIDNKEGDLFAVMFTVDVDARYPGLARLRGLDSFTRWMNAFHADFDATQHLVSNPSVALDGDDVVLRTYIQARLMRRDSPDGDHCTGGGYYLDRVVRTAAGWRIRSRHVFGRWQEGNVGLIRYGLAAVDKAGL